MGRVALAAWLLRLAHACWPCREACRCSRQKPSPQHHATAGRCVAPRGQSEHRLMSVRAGSRGQSENRSEAWDTPVLELRMRLEEKNAH